MNLSREESFQGDNCAFRLPPAQSDSLNRITELTGFALRALVLKNLYRVIL